MQKPIHYKANNWVDGMKLASDHFIKNDLYVADALRDIASLPLIDYNYGFLPDFNTGKDTQGIVVLDKGSGFLEVVVNSCNAVTADGCRIDIHAQTATEALRLNSSLRTSELVNGTHYVVIQVNPFKRIPTGVPDPQESPMRYPEVRKEYSLQMLSEQSLLGENVQGFFLPIAQLYCVNGTASLSKGYIPPSVCLQSQAKLLAIHAKWYRQLVEIQQSAFSIMDKTAATQKNVSELGLNIRMLSSKLLDFIASAMFTYRYMLPSQSPIYMVEYFSSLAHTFFTGIRIVASGPREEMLNYFYEWKDVTPGNFEERIADVIELNYNHLNCVQSLDMIDDFMLVLRSLWAKLATLEYIGQRRENIVVAEQKVVQELQTRRTWSLLD